MRQTKSFYNAAYIKITVYSYIAEVSTFLITHSIQSLTNYYKKFEVDQFQIKHVSSKFLILSLSYFLFTDTLKFTFFYFDRLNK